MQHTLDSKITISVRQLSREHGVTLFMTLLSAFNVLLSRYSGQDDLVIGTPIANRTHHQTEGIIGFFVNTLVLRTIINQELSFKELLKQVRQTTLDAYTHQDIPFESLVEKLNPARSLSHSPLFQVMFALQNSEQESFELKDLKISFLKPEYSIAKFDLTLSMTEHNDSLVCDWEYSTDLFKHETITLLNEHFKVLLVSIINKPEQKLSEITLLTRTEQEKMISWNRTEMDYPQDKTL